MSEIVSTRWRSALVRTALSIFAFDTTSSSSLAAGTTALHNMVCIESSLLSCAFAPADIRPYSSSLTVTLCALQFTGFFARFAVRLGDIGIEGNHVEDTGIAPVVPHNVRHLVAHWW